MIFKTALSNGEFEFNLHKNLNEAIEDLVNRNTAAGRKVKIGERDKTLAQFTLTYPSINRMLGGTIGKAMLRRNAIDPKDALPYIPAFKKLKKKNLSMEDIGRRLGMTWTMATMVAREAKKK